MTQRRNAKNHPKKEGKSPAPESENGKSTDRGGAGGAAAGRGGGGGGGGRGNSLLTWLVVLGLLGVWTSVALVHLDLVDYHSLIARMKQFPLNFSQVLQGRLRSYDADGDGDFDVDDAKVLLGLHTLLHTHTEPHRAAAEEPHPASEPLAEAEPATQAEATESGAGEPGAGEPGAAEPGAAEPGPTEPGPAEPGAAEPSQDPGAQLEEKPKVKEAKKKKKPKLLNKLDKSIKAEIDAAEKLRKKGKLQEALQAFDQLVQQYPLSPRARYGKAQSEDELAEQKRSNQLLQLAIASYGAAADLPDVTPDLLRAALSRRAERQQFLGRVRGSLATLERLTQHFPEDTGARNQLGVAHLLLGDNKAAKRVYEEVLSSSPDDGFAQVHYGFILKSENKIAESISYLQGGLESGAAGTDDGRFYFHLGDALQRVGERSRALHWYQLGHERGHFASVWQRSLYNVAGLTARPWWTAAETGYTKLVKMLERNWRTIRDEALAVMDQNTGLFVPEDENLRERGEWGQYTLWQQGRKAGKACQGVPKTCSLLEGFPEATGCKRGQVKFSIMQPGTHVWPHTGPTNCRLRMHLGLVIPQQGCSIRCTDQTRQWEEGRVLIFDDSFEHEVWQQADSFRLIFIVDVWHPELTEQQRQTLSPI